MRLPFLILTPACVVLGLGTAVWTSAGVNTLYFVLALIGGLASHISVNAFNEYFDFKSGLDMKTERTPFSGGSGTLPANPEFASRALATAIVALAVICLVGFYFIYVWGWAIAPLGVLGLLVILSYTPWAAHRPLVSLVAPGLGFGTFMVMGTDFVLTGTYTWTAFIASCVPFFLVNNLLLLNQFPDVVADSAVGRKNFPIIIGRRPSSLIYSAFLVLTYASIALGVKYGLLPDMALLGLITIVLAIPAGVGAYLHADNIKGLIPFLGMNVLINILTPVLVAVGLIVG
jgi:1,4-dihydroxy-2-naphthoate octaprenyltransferase